MESVNDVEQSLLADEEKHEDERTPLLKASSRALSYDSATGRPLGNFHCHDEKAEEDDNSSSFKAKRVLWMSLALCLVFMICEIVGGLLAQSLAIITDAAHLLTDFASMLISLFSLYIASRPASQRMSFGFHRAEVLGAFFSVFLIWIVTGVLVYLAIARIISQEYDIDATIMAATAAIGVCVNLIMGALLYFGGHTHSHLGGGSHGHSHGGGSGHSHAEHGHGGSDDDHSSSSDSGGHGHAHAGKRRQQQQNINVRAAFIHVLGDLIQSVGVLLAALVIFFFNYITFNVNRYFHLWRNIFMPSWSIVDPICTLLFSIIVLFTTIYILRDALVVLLEGRPSSIDFVEVFSALTELDGVRKVHDLRIWALTMDKVAISVHIEISPDAKSDRVLRKTRAMLRNKYNVHESTVQIETFTDETADCDRCDPPK